MGNKRVMGFEAYEDVGIGIVNFDGSVTDPENVKKVKEGTARYLMRPGGVLSIVPSDHQLAEFEHFVTVHGDPPSFLGQHRDVSMGCKVAGQPTCCKPENE